MTCFYETLYNRVFGVTDFEFDVKNWELELKDSIGQTYLKLFTSSYEPGCEGVFKVADLEFYIKIIKSKIGNQIWRPRFQNVYIFVWKVAEDIF